MKCPVDQTELKRSMHGEIEIDQCSRCQGMWLDRAELDTVEDVHFNQDDFKGSLETEPKETDRTCSVCGKRMRQIDYRYNDLLLELCPEGHGWWLDGGEVDRIEQLMAQRKKDVLRSTNLEADWVEEVEILRSPSIIDNIIREMKKFFN